MTGRGGLEAVYLDSVLELRWEDGSRTQVEARPTGTTIGPFPDGVERIHVITAWNPRSQRTSSSENADRNERLRVELDRAGWRYLDVLGRSRDGTWSEDSFAVVDGDPEAVLVLARRFEQHATFEWTPDHLAVRWSDAPARRSVRGWAVTDDAGRGRSR